MEDVKHVVAKGYLWDRASHREIQRCSFPFPRSIFSLLETKCAKHAGVILPQEFQDSGKSR